ncbi:hypothetical protein ACSLVK_00880 [Photorhabdus tasmaniensis]|uniref:hypothetical protein n=1 Tax=Photorhabdus TaxID=29487 RepID=UPI001AD80E3E
MKLTFKSPLFYKCLASHYLAAWTIACLEGIEAAESVLHYVAPEGEKEEYIAIIPAQVIFLNVSDNIIKSMAGEICRG